MTQVNQRGELIIEVPLFEHLGDLWNTYTEQDRNDAITLLCQHLKVTIIRTNATKDGDYQLKLRR